MNVRPLIALLIFPGLLYAVPMAWLMLWTERKIMAKMQKRIGPPFYQPFFDFIKLMTKRPIYRSMLDRVLLTALPLLAAAAMLVALSLLPVFPDERGFIGDVILLAALMEVPPLCSVMAGFASRSIFGEIGAVREAFLSMIYSLPFLAALLALCVSAGSLRLSDAALLPSLAVRVPALIALVLCLPAKLRLNPFSLTNAEQEIYSGPTTELDGALLALWELAHGLEWVVLAGLTVSLATPLRSGSWLVDAAMFAVFSMAVVLLMVTLAAATARIKVPQAGRFYLRWGFGISVLALILAALPV